jgi:hypothetical protein
MTLPVPGGTTRLNSKPDFKEACEFVAGPLSPAGCDKRRVTTNPPGKQTSSVSLIAVQKIL